MKVSEINKDIFSGKLNAAIAEFWFKYIGYSFITAAFQVGQQYTNNMFIVVATFISYLALIMWLRHKMENVFCYFWPALSFDNEKRPAWYQIVISNTFIIPFAFATFAFGVQVADILTSLKI